MFPYAGEIFSVGSACVWALAIVLFRRAHDVPAFGINLCKNTLAVVLTGATLLVMGEPIATDRSGEDWARLLVSGVLGLGLGDAMFITALKKTGPAIAAIVECAYAPSVVVFAIVLNGESLASGFYLGAPLVIAGVYYASRPAKLPAGLMREVIGHRGSSGILLGTAAMAIIGLGIVIAKPALERSDIVEAAFVRMLGALAFQLCWALSSRRRWPWLRVLGPGAHWPKILPSALLGSYVGMMLWIGGMKLTEASVSAILNQTSTLFTLVFARLLVGELFTRKRIIGGLLAAGGAIVIVLRVSF